MNLANILHENTAPQNDKVIAEEVFKALLKNAVFHLNDGAENFNFHSKIETHEIDFGLTDGIFTIEDFGFTINGNWITLKVTDSQRQQMIKICEDKKAELLKEEEKEETFREPDSYESTGTNPKKFY